jgi:hypothetical protein
MATLDGTQMYFIDEAVTAGSTYQYRYYLQKDNEVSLSTAASSVTTELQNPDFRNFVSDGESDEWKVVSPLATRFVEGKTLTLRLFADRDSLNILLEGASSKTYSVYLNTDEKEATGVTDETWASSGFDYLIKDGAMYKAQGQTWSLLSTVNATLGTAGLEVSVSLASFTNLEDNIRIKTAAVIKLVSGTVIELPFADQPTPTYVRMLPARTPTSLTVTNSEATPESRLVIAWESECIQCKGFVLERSENSETGFSEIFRTSSAMLYRNDNLEVNKTYYYRIYAFNETGRSDYSPVMSGTTHSSVTGIEQIERTAKVYPVPVDNVLTVQTEGRLHSVAVRDALGHSVSAREVERDATANQIKIDLSSLSPGMYILWIHSGDHQFPYKILKK